MSNVYRRESLPKKKKRKKKKDDHARKRNEIINFRVSPEEKELIEARINISGLPRAEFFIESCLFQKITVIGNIKTFDVMSKQLDRIETIVRSSIHEGVFSAVEVENFETIVEILDSRNRNENTVEGDDDIEDE